MSTLPETVSETQERRLVIALDYGTTYTGIAFASPAGNRAHLHEIGIVNYWGPDMDNLDKVPSVISYSRASDEREQQWGGSLSPEAVAMVHTKLELDVHNTSEELDLILGALDGMYDLHFEAVRAAGSLPQYTWKGPETIVQDYLSRVVHALLHPDTGDRFPEELRTRMPVDIVVTIPADWSYRAKNSTFRALTQAGFNKKTFPLLTDMLLVSEPEAAAIYTARYLKESNGADFLRKGECFALCDAGGGTVDVVSYRVEELHPTFNIEAVTLATGRRCGSIFIELEFKKWLRDLIGIEYCKLDPGQVVQKISSHYTEGRQMRQLMRNFNKLKLKFRKDSRDMKMDLPEPLHNLNIPDPPDHLSINNRVVGGEITITNATMRSFFAPCVGRIIELIEGQIGQVERLGTRLQNIFLVGGFAESEYLQEEIRYSLQLRDIQLRRPDTSWTAVVRGAVIVGIEKSNGRALSAMKACPRSFGVSVSEYFSETRHNLQDYFTDPITGTPMAKEQLIWLIKKGDLILSNEQKVVNQLFTKIFSETGTREGQIPVYAYSDDKIPGRFSNSQRELTPVHTFEYNLTDIPLREFIRQQLPDNKPPFYVATLRLTMILGPQVLRAELCWKDSILESKDINYN